MASEIVKLTLGLPEDPTEVPRAMITNANGSLLGFWDATERWIAARFEGSDTAYFEAVIDERIRLLRAVPDPGWPR